MPKLSLKGKLGRVAAAAAMLGLGATTFIAQIPTSGADPAQLDAGVLKGVGSDTLQDVTNALAGGTNGISYKALLAARTQRERSSSR